MTVPSIRLVTHSLLDELADKADASPRRRAHFELHEGGRGDPLQRFIVVARGDSYFRPHRHADKGELCTVLRGRVEFVVFDDEGRVLERQTVGEGAALASQMPPRTWHTLVPRADVCAFLEAKLGPYDPATAAEFAEWAPVEGTEEAQRLREWLAVAKVGERFAP